MMENLNTPIENNDKPKAQKPRIFLVLKIIVGLLLAAGITLIICGSILYEGFSMMVFGGFTCLVFCIPLSIFAFSPNIHKTAIKTQKYIIDQNQEDLKDLSSQTGEIASAGVKHVAKAAKEGFTEDKIFCKHCGAEIDADSKFCSYCGKEQ